jgi:CubicO group peptidase (beta-lactamase class C family)
MPLDPAAIDSVIADIPAFSGVALVVERGSVLYQRALGYANRSDQLPNTLTTRFGIASGTKTFTAVAIGQLVARGLLSLDQPLATCAGVPLPWLHPGVTLHHLLTHTSGAPDYFDEAIMDDYAALWHDVPMYRIRRSADFLPLMQDRPMQFEPGARFHYNNGGFVLLGQVIEHVTGMSLPEYMAEHLFRAADMRDSGYFATDQLPARTAYGYVDDPQGSGWRTNFFAIPIIGGGDGGAYVTAPDVIAFWRALLNHTLLPAPLTQAMLTPHTAAEEGMSYGYGLWMVQLPDGTPRYSMMGGDPGVSFRVVCYPDRDLQIVAIGNVSSGAGRIADAIAALAES